MNTTPERNRTGQRRFHRLNGARPGSVGKAFHGEIKILTSNLTSYLLERLAKSTLLAATPSPITKIRENG